MKLNSSETNSCDYRTSILCAVAPSAGLSADDILAGRTGISEDHRTEAAVKFAEAVLKSSGKVSDDQLANVRKAGLDDAEIVEIVTSVVLSCFMDFLNNVADMELDIPQAQPVAASMYNSGTCSVN